MSSQDASDAEELSRLRADQAATDAADLARFRAELLTKPAPAAVILVKPIRGGIIGTGTNAAAWSGQ